MSKIKNEIESYLLTLQLIKAGYEITHDEIIEQTCLKEFFSVPEADRKEFFQGKRKLNQLYPSYQWYKHYCITVTQEKEWFLESCKIVEKIFDCGKLQASVLVEMISLSQGLTLKGS